MILEAFAATTKPLVFVGNWDNSAYGRNLRDQYANHPNLRLLDPIYAPGPLFTLRQGASSYVHGHSAGGTNPALVEMMHFGHPILAYDCEFNRQTTLDSAAFFADVDGLALALQAPPTPNAGAALRAIAQDQYTWAKVGAQYFDLFSRIAAGGN